MYKDRTQESTEGDGNDGGSEVDPRARDLYGDGLGTEGDGEELEHGSEVDPGDFKRDS